jgi:UDP-N-acetylmuramoyl-L-alanyl-D-glutamate--2,6-diaminopimelate ligase
VLIAGKGHENYQEFADHTIPFDDIQVARRAIEDHPVEL